MTYYDRESDIVYVEVESTDVARSVEREWGLIDLGEDGQVLGLECWDASDRLPAELLGALPPPKPRSRRPRPRSGRPDARAALVEGLVESGRAFTGLRWAVVGSE